MGNLVLNATVANVKFKSRKSTKGRSSSKTSSRGYRKGSFDGRSFLDANIKTAGKTDFRRKTLVPTEEKKLDIDMVDNELPEKTSVLSVKENKFNSEGKNNEKQAIKMLYLKEKKDIKQAHGVLMDEYWRRRELRTNIMSKFGRASAHLKIILAGKKVYEHPETFARRSSVIREVFVGKMDDSKNQEKRRRFAYNRIEDADQI